MRRRRPGRKVYRLGRRTTTAQHALRQAHGGASSSARPAQAALRESEARYRALVESQLDLISRYLPDTTLTFANDAYCRFYGRTREELIGHSFLSMVAPEFREGVLKETQESAKAARTTIGEYLNFTQDGEPCWIQWIIRGIADDSNRVVEFQAVGRDITSIKTAEEALRQANLVVDNSSVVLFRWKASEPWPVSYVSQNVVQFGYTPTELLAGDTAYTDLVHPDDLHRFLEEVRQGLAAGVERIQREYRIVSKRGEVRWVDERTAIERDADGRVSHYQGIVIDITERKTLESQLQRAMKMDAVGRLAGGVAHDFNNLLTAIGGNLELIEMDFQADARPPDYVRDAKRATESAAALVRQLLSISRQQILEPRALDLKEILEDLRAMLSRVVGEHVVLDCFSPSDLGLVRLDLTQFEQILINLAVNARDAMPNGGRLRIETSNVALGPDYCREHSHMKPGPFVLLSVSDTGCGMSDEVKQRLFEPFFTTKPVGRGTGLGLATVFDIVKRSGGCIEVSSEPGQGSTFKIHLPRAAKSDVAQRDPRPSGPLPLGRETILLVEDEAHVRALAGSFLKRLGYLVLVATNGHDALKVANEWDAPIDLLFTDVVMPRMNGRELAERLRHVRPLTKVRYSSGYTDDIIVHHGVVQAQLDLIAKPYSIQSLARKVRLVLDRAETSGREAQAADHQTPR